jgi:hypothetical protein
MDRGDLLAIAVRDEQPRRVRADVDAGTAHDRERTAPRLNRRPAFARALY